MSNQIKKTTCVDSFGLRQVITGACNEYQHWLNGLKPLLETSFICSLQMFFSSCLQQQTAGGSGLADITN